MSGKLFYTVAVTPIVDTTHEGTTMAKISSILSGSLKVSVLNNSWGGLFSGWSGGACSHKTSETGVDNIAVSNVHGVWIKHTGFTYNAAKANNIDYDNPFTGLFHVRVGNPLISLAVLDAGEGIFIPTPGTTTFYFYDTGIHTAIEWGVF